MRQRYYWRIATYERNLVRETWTMDDAFTLEEVMRNATERFKEIRERRLSIDAIRVKRAFGHPPYVTMRK